VRDAAAFLLRCYSAGALHKDMKATNVLTRETAEGVWEFVLLDMAAVRFPSRVTRAQKLLNLAQLNASTPLALTWTDRLRLLKRLAAADSDFAGRQSVREIAEMTNRRERVWAR